MLVKMQSSYTTPHYLVLHSYNKHQCVLDCDNLEHPNFSTNIVIMAITSLSDIYDDILKGMQTP